MESKIHLETIVSRPFMENTFVARREDRNDCLVFDPGFEPEAITEFLTRERLIPAAILNTHGHVDHIAGNEALKRCWPECPLVIGKLEAAKLTDPDLNLSGKYGFGIVSPPADVTVVDGETYSAAGFDLLVRDTPGHSSGHVIFILAAEPASQRPAIVFGGDVLFKQSVGRTDFPDGDFEQLAAAIREKMFTLPDDTIVLPGHGEPTTIGDEKRFNPFVNESPTRFR